MSSVRDGMVLQNCLTFSTKPVGMSSMTPPTWM